MELLSLTSVLVLKLFKQKSCLNVHLLILEILKFLLIRRYWRYFHRSTARLLNRNCKTRFGNGVVCERTSISSRTVLTMRGGSSIVNKFASPVALCQLLCVCCWIFPEMLIYVNDIFVEDHIDVIFLWMWIKYLLMTSDYDHITDSSSDHLYNKNTFY